MNSRLATYVALSGAALIAVHPLLAQETSGVTATLDLDQRFESGSNLGLTIPDEGDTSLSTTSLDFRLTSQNNTDILDLRAAGKYRFGDIPITSNAQQGFGDPLFFLGFERDTGNATVEVDAGFRQNEISLIQPFDTFADSGGNPNLPGDFDNLSGSGKRNAYILSFDMETGRDDPVGFVLNAGLDAIEYVDTTSRSLFDNKITRFGTGLRIHPSGATTGILDLTYRRYQEDNPLDTDRETRRVILGVESEFAQDALLNASVGYSEVITKETIGTDTEAGPIAELSFEQGMANGTASASLVSNRDQNGQRVTIRAGRSLELPRGEFSASIGATKKESFDPQLVGSLNFTQELPRSTIIFNLNREVRTDRQDEERLTTRLGLRYNHEINSISSVSFDYGFSLADANAVSNQSDRTALSLSYNHALTRDWALRVGVQHQMRDEETVGTAESNSVFVSIGRSFDLLR